MDVNETCDHFAIKGWAKVGVLLYVKQSLCLYSLLVLVVFPIKTTVHLHLPAFVFSNLFYSMN